MSEQVFPRYAVKQLQLKLTFQQCDYLIDALSLVTITIKTSEELAPSGQEELTVFFKDKIFYLHGASKGSIYQAGSYITEFALYFDNVSTFKTWQTFVKVVHRTRLKKLMQQCRIT